MRVCDLGVDVDGLELTEVKPFLPSFHRDFEAYHTFRQLVNWDESKRQNSG